jgi:toxin HigB-1
MNINFKSHKLTKIFNSDKELCNAYGKQMGQVIKRRMMVLNAAPTLEHVSHLPPERLHELEGKRKETFAVDLIHPFRLILKPDHNPIPYNEAGGIDLSKVTSVTILGVEDYH